MGLAVGGLQVVGCAHRRILSKRETSNWTSSAAPNCGARGLTLIDWRVIWPLISDEAWTRATGDSQSRHNGNCGCLRPPLQHGKSRWKGSRAALRALPSPNFTADEPLHEGESDQFCGCAENFC